MIKGVIFDMDGTMFDTERLSAISWKKAGEKLHLDIQDELIDKIQGRNPAAIRKDLWGDSEKIWIMTEPAE